MNEILNLVEYGFSLNDIELLRDYDIREVVQLKQQAIVNAQINKLLNKLDLSEAFYYGIISMFSKDGYKLYKKWHSNICRKINKLKGRKEVTIWDKLTRKSNRI